MKVVALVSGGKDSCYAMMRCIHYGHQIVALANLLPQHDNVDELDSYMYQTVGHQIVESYAACMGLPLFRRRIRGNSKRIQMRYAETEGDEVEDLEVLLREVMKRVPSVSAVSTGAIASNYQRLRVENVCSRLGLVSLAYLWMQDQDELLQQMIESQISAVLVKVAAMGLYPHKHLGKDLSTMYPELFQLHGQYGCNICGEGGEYETITLDCPLFKHARIVLDDYDIVVSSAEVGILHPKQFHLEPKAYGDSNEQNGAVYWVEDDAKRSETKHWPVEAPVGTNGECRLTASEQYLTISCWLAKASNEGAGQELSLLLSLVRKHLEKEGLSWGDVLYIHLYIQNMKDFAEVNSVYSRHITEVDCPNGVPSRSTVAVPAARGQGEVMVEVLAARNQSKRVLHVQSISCWAPSCIGPYSQATLHEHLLFMAGQIGLDPPTMVLVTGGAGAETSQCLSNAEAVAQSFGVALFRSSISLVVYCNVSTSRDERNAVEAQLSSFHAAPVLFVLVSDLPKGASVEIEPLLLCPPPENTEVTVEAGSRNTFTIQSGSVTVFSDCYHIPGHLCRCFFYVDYDKSSSGPMIQKLVAAVETVLGEAHLQWSSVLTLRAYHVEDEVPGLRDSLEVHVPAMVMVRVLGTGHRADLNYGLALDLVAKSAA